MARALGGRGGGFPKRAGGGLLCLVSCGVAPYTQARPLYPGTFYLEPVPGGRVRPFFKWVGPTISGGQTGLKIAPCPWSRASCTASCFPIGLGNRRYCFPLTFLGGGVLYVDAAFDVNKFKVGVWGPTLGGRVFPAPRGSGPSKRPSSKPWCVESGSSPGWAGLCGVS